jgi:hypothetical protein
VEKYQLVGFSREGKRGENKALHDAGLLLPSPANGTANHGMLITNNPIFRS